MTFTAILNLNIINLKWQKSTKLCNFLSLQKMGIETKMQLVRLTHDWVLYNKEIRGKKKRGLGSNVHTNDDYGTTPESQSNLEK